MTPDQLAGLVGVFAAVLMFAALVLGGGGWMYRRNVRRLRAQLAAARKQNAKLRRANTRVRDDEVLARNTEQWLDEDSRAHLEATFAALVRDITEAGGGR